MADGQSYPVDNVNKVKRVYERGRYDHETVHKILDQGMMCHVSYVIDGQPYCTPTLYWREGTRLYWHGSSASRMLRNLSEGEPACLTVSFLDSLVLARCGFNHSVDYRAVMCFGKARLVEDQAEKEQALVMMVDRFFPGRTAQIRASSRQEIKATGVVYMDIEKASAKIRAKGIGDEEEDYLLPIYAERIPVYQTLGEPEPCKRLLEGVTRPDTLSMYSPGKPLEKAVLEAYEVSYSGSYPDLAKKA